MKNGMSATLSTPPQSRVGSVPATNASTITRPHGPSPRRPDFRSIGTRTMLAGRANSSFGSPRSFFASIFWKNSTQSGRAMSPPVDPPPRDFEGSS
jgi:hypothetical protein